jgi:MerR family copper efflux transcriptional regulator
MTSGLRIKDVAEASGFETVAATIQAVSVSAEPAATGDPAIACTLSAGSMKGRMADWQALLAHVERRTSIDGGVRSVFAPSLPMDDLTRLVAAEQDCCQFFRFAITVDARGVALEVRAPEDARSIVESMFGAPS